MPDKKEIKACIAFLETNPNIEYNPYPCYPTEVTQALGFMEPDYDYYSAVTIIFRPLAAEV